MDSLSVIIPAYNAEAYLGEAVGSVRSQNWGGKLEILVADDGSSDQSAAAAERLGVTVLLLEHLGAAAARNAGLRRAGGDLILFLDADDLLAEGALSSLYAPMAADASVEAVFSMALDFVSPELTLEQSKQLLPRRSPYEGMLSGCALLRREAAGRAGFFNETYRTGETVDWLLRLRDANVKSVSLPEVTLRRRLHMNNTGRTQKQAERSDYAAILRSRMQQK